LFWLSGFGWKQFVGMTLMTAMMKMMMMMMMMVMMAQNATAFFFPVGFEF
jgi:hypothetical protein